MQSPMRPEECYQQGIKLLSQNKWVEAEQAFRVALADRPNWAEAHHQLGTALAGRGMFAPAVTSLTEALRLRPDFAEAHHGLANCLRRSGKAKESLDHYRRALQLKPGVVEVHNNFGLALRATGSLDEALDQFRLALRSNPRYDDARINLGNALSDKGLTAEAIAAYRQVLETRPNSPETRNNLGVVLVQQGSLEEGIANYRAALELRPKYAEARNNLGIALRQKGELGEAEVVLREAVQLKPDYAEAFSNLAIVLLEQERVEEGIENYRQALRIKPTFPDARKNLALALLAQGNFAEGWQEYEWRWNPKTLPARHFQQPRWDGGPLEGKTILLHAEQGLGDTIQFIRYAATVEQLGGRIVLACQKALVGLLERSPSIVSLVAQGDPLPPFDVHAPLMSLPGIFGTTLESIPATTPYLFPDPDRVRLWGDELKGLTGFKIGIAWQGSARYHDDVNRSIRLTNFEPVAKIPGTRLINLQKGRGTEQLSNVAAWNIVDFGQRLDEQGAFLDTAAIMKHLDLVITSDTSIAHLAGALGVPVWVAIGKHADWRWLLEREDSPWYPTMRLFRQSKRGEWRDVFERMAHELEMQPPLESADRHAQKGMELFSQGKRTEAIVALQRAVELDSQNAVLRNNLGIALDKEGKKAEALSQFQEATRLKPDYADALHNLGNQLRRIGQLAEAEEQCRKGIQVIPNSADLHNQLGLSLLAQAKHDEGEVYFRRALKLKPEHADAHNNLGVLLEQRGELAEATASFQESLRLKPDSGDAHKNLALIWLMQGDWGRGWAEYEWRLKYMARADRFSPDSRWDGKPLNGKTILLYHEQGLGDTLQFIRYASLVKQRGGVVVAEVPAALEKVLARCPAIDRLVVSGSPLPNFSCQAAMLSLPGIFHTTLDSVPAEVPYLTAEPRLIEAWRQELNRIDGVKIGIIWQGSQKYTGDGHRSIPLAAFEPVARIPGIRLVSLQKNFGAEQLQSVVRDWNVLDFGDRLDAAGAFLDTAAIMSNLDLVVTSDTSLAHLAGALGVPVWLALSAAADWRWQRHRADCPWYPTMRLFRQKRWGDWQDVFQTIANEIQRNSFAIRAPLLAEIAPGELLDKITILEIKRARTPDEQKLQNIRLELGTLLAVRAKCLRNSAKLDALTAELKGINEDLWQIEDDIRLKEQAGDFGREFVELARSVYLKNDQRAAIKKKINQLLGSRIIEEKSYAGNAT